MNHGYLDQKFRAVLAMPDVYIHAVDVSWAVPSVTWSPCGRGHGHVREAFLDRIDRLFADTCDPFITEQHENRGSLGPFITTRIAATDEREGERSVCMPVPAFRLGR